MVKFLFALICVVYFHLNAASMPMDQLLQEAHISYEEGVQADTFEQRKLAFNHSLTLYSIAENQLGEANFELNQAIGNLYYQLNEYPWAVLYYRRALKIRDSDPLLISHLHQAQKKLGLSVNKSILTKTWTQYLLLEPYFSLDQKLRGLFWMSGFVFILFSIFIWMPRRSLKNSILCSMIVLSLLLVNILVSYYSSPLEGIMISSSKFYREPNKNQPQISNQLLLAGTEVKVLEANAAGDWLKILNEENIIGFVPASKVRLIAQ